MMAKLEGLIKVQKHRVDEKQKILARLLREEEELNKKKEQHKHQIESETSIFNEMESDPLTQLSFNNFIENAKNKIHDIEQKIEGVHNRIDIAQDSIRRAFEELKKTETVNKNRKDKEKKAALKKENQELDEIGISGHLKKKKEG